jgi:phosphoserine phosphatase RsbU/P
MDAATGIDRRRYERIRTLTEVSRALTYTTSIEEVLRLAVARAAELMDAEKAVIMLNDADGLLTVRAAWGVDEARLQECREPLDETLIRRLQGLLGYSADECFLSVPLVARGEVTGLLAAVRTGSAPAAPDDEWLLSALADQASVALENARLSQAVQDERAAHTLVIEAQGRAHAMLGHELRSPLTAIQAYSELLREEVLGSLNERQRDAVSRIQMSGQHLLAVIESILDTARIGAGMLKLTSRDVPVADVLAEATQMLQPLAAAKNQELRIHDGEALVVRADPHRLRQALMNLISNAIKYTGTKGRVEVEVRATVSAGAAFAAITVRDNGRGIAPDVLPSIFHPYSRAGAPASESGLGLGLFITREVLRQMDGWIEVKSELGAGSTFTAYLPLAAGAEDAVDAADATGPSN